jgi:hypothetical protein
VSSLVFDCRTANDPGRMSPAMPVKTMTARERDKTIDQIATTAEKFDTLFGLLKDNYAGVFDFEFKNVTVLTLLLGWSLASNDARSFLHTHPRIAYCACGALLLYVVLLLVSFWKFYRRSLLTYAQLSQLGYMPTEYFRVRRIQPYTVVSFTVLNWTLAFIISAVILFA